MKDRLLLNSHVHPDDIPVLRQLLTGAYQGLPLFFSGSPDSEGRWGSIPGAGFVSPTSLTRAVNR